MYAKLINNLETLKLEKMVTHLPEYLKTIAKENIDFTEAMLHLTEIEIAHKTAIASKTQITVANFPFVKRVGDYDFTFQPAVNKAVIKDLCSLRFIESKENILFYGTPGVGYVK